jgi:DNA-directed RNA polymerase subunit RPC12/RpoP
MWLVIWWVLTDRAVVPYFLMAIWDKGTEGIVCRHCGATHQADYREYLLSEVGSQNCLECGKELISWSGTRAYIVFRLEK